MSIPRAKPRSNKPDERVFESVKRTNYLNLAIMVRTLHQVYGWRSKRLGNFVESYIALMEEVGTTNTVQGLIRDAKELTGIDVKVLLDEVWSKNHE